MSFKCNKLTMMIASCLLLMPYLQAWAVDIVRLNKSYGQEDTRKKYKIDVITAALELTKPIYGEYKIITKGAESNIERAILEIKSGKSVNTFFAVTTNEWEENTLPIRIPIRRGILNFRLLTIHKNQVRLFAGINSVDDLKPLKVGVRTGWATANVLKEKGFNVFEAESYSGLFYMLSTGRIDYIPLGINDIFVDLEKRHNELPDLIVQDSLALQITAPLYIFVSPDEKRLAKRLTVGLEMMLENKKLHDIFADYYEGDLIKSELSRRHLLKIENNDLPIKTPLNRKELWFEHDKLPLL